MQVQPEEYRVRLLKRRHHQHWQVEQLELEPRHRILLQVAALEKRQQVPKHISKANTQRQNSKSAKEKKHGTNLPNKWTK